MKILQIELVVELVIIIDPFQMSFHEIVHAGTVVIVIFAVKCSVMRISRALAPFEVLEPLKFLDILVNEHFKLIFLVAVEKKSSVETY